MSSQNIEPGTEWIFCREIEGQCPGLNPNSQVLEKIPKIIKVHGKEVRGWMVKIVQEKSEGHVNLNITNLSNE
ncbi:MAG: hypothetical protein ACYC9O_04550 [Candidatus Latescibacterota bacterium]